MTKKLKNIGSNKKLKKITQRNKVGYAHNFLPFHLDTSQRTITTIQTFSMIAIEEKKKKLYINYMRELRKYQNKIGYIGAR